MTTPPTTLRKITAQEVRKVLDLHVRFLDRRPGGQRASLAYTDLTGFQLDRADLREADFTGARLNAAFLSETNLEGATLYGVDLRGSDLRAANLTKADLRGACLRGANLARAKLISCDLREGQIGLRQAALFFLAGALILDQVDIALE